MLVEGIVVEVVVVVDGSFTGEIVPFGESTMVGVETTGQWCPRIIRTTPESYNSRADRCSKHVMRCRGGSGWLHGG